MRHAVNEGNLLNPCLRRARQTGIERVRHLKLGVGIWAQRIADEATGEVLVKGIEVKGRLRGWPVRLTINERLG